jgi:Ser/Thr protein kinase RdoA (MazF antagonist)
MFNREAGALITIIPAVFRLLDEASHGEFQPWVARCLYYHSGSPATAIALDDLKEQGFRMADSRAGLDMQHCLLVMKALAQLHAASAVLHLKDPEIFRPYSESYYYCERLRKILQPSFELTMQIVAKEVEKWPLYNTRFASKLHKIAENVVDFLIKDVERNDDDFNVLIHGDFKLNNMMFRYSDDTQEVLDVRYILVAFFLICKFCFVLFFSLLFDIH